MRVSYNWLSELIPDLDISAEIVGQRLTGVGLELEEQIEFGQGLEDVRICAVSKVEPHPSRDKLRLVTVDRGDATQRVVCGASNVPEPGGLVVLAPLGTYLPAVDLKLEPRKLGGIVSEGMLCSETELGLGTESDGILTFSEGRFAPGTRFLDAFPFARDTVYELGITPNRPDALGHIGVARDLAATLKLDWTPPNVPSVPAESEKSLRDLVRVDNQARERCPSYGAAVVESVRVDRSPEWLRWRLYFLGIRPISNVVDITNLLLLEYGNPMHAFDLARVAGAKIVIRKAAQGETMTTLDGEKRQLVDSDLVIADGEQPSALAGIMGGADSEIKTDTKTVLLECAYFEPTGIRRTARRLGMHSDSSYRFERGVNYASLSDVLRRASLLLCELAGGRAVGGQIFENGELPSQPEVRLRKSQIARLLGVEVDFSEATSTLDRLGFEILERSESEVRVRVCPWRPDVSLEADLIEEVARIRGLDSVPTRLPRIAPQAPNPAGKFERRVREWSSAVGLSEAVTYSFVNPEELDIIGAPKPTVVLKNPLSQERSVMTTSLLPGLLEAVKRARRRGESDVRLFTVASRFLAAVTQLHTSADQAARPRSQDDIGRLPQERLSFAAVLSGHRPSYLQKPEAVDVYDAKGLACQLVSHFAGPDVDVRWAGQEPALAHLHPRTAATVWLGEAQVGSFGTLHPEVVDKLELDAPVQIVEIDLVAVEALQSPAPKYRPIPKLPAVTRDIAVEVGPELSAGKVRDAIAENAGELCESVTLFDLFEGGKLAEGHRSLAFRIVYRDPKATTDPDNAKTLTDKQVDKRHTLVIQAMERLGATPRA